MKKIKILAVLFAISSIYSCEKKESLTTDTTKNDTILVTKEDNLPIGDTSETSVDWDGTYLATLPCADCPGIDSRLTLNKDKTFELYEEYQDSDVTNSDKGTFSFDKTGSIITLKGKEFNLKLKVGENILFLLDQEGKVIDNSLKEHFIYKKTHQ